MTDQRQKWSAAHMRWWKDRMRQDGVTLTVEINLTLEEFRKFLELTLGYIPSDSDVREFQEMAHRRILPPDQGSFSGFGWDIGNIVREFLESQSPIKEDESC